MLCLGSKYFLALKCGYYKLRAIFSFLNLYLGVWNTKYSIAAHTFFQAVLCLKIGLQGSFNFCQTLLPTAPA